MKRYKFIGKVAVNFGFIGDVEPGQEFDVDPEHYDLFEGTELFKQVKVLKKEVKKEVKEEDCPGCPKAKKEE